MSRAHTSRVLGAATAVTTFALILTGFSHANASISRSVACHGSGGGSAGLRAAIKAANAHGGGRIDLARNCTYSFAKGPYRDQAGGNALPIITSSIEIVGNQATLVRDSGKPFRFFEVSDGGALEVHDATLTGGRTATDVQETYNGGAIYSLGRLVLHHVTLKKNVSANGGAIQADKGTVRITDSTLKRNHARDVPGATAGAIAVGGARVTIRRTTIARNDAYAKGGAIAVFAGVVRISESTLAGNTLSINGAGGAIFNYGKLTIDRTTLAANEANGFGGNGGAIANYDRGELTLTESEITDNTAGMTGAAVSSAFGGGIANFGSAQLTKVEITRNKALGGKAKGGGIAVRAGVLSIAKSTVTRNSPNNCSGEIQGRC